MIICGYAGIGKSYLGHNAVGVIDLESTPFEKDWERYAKCAIHYSNQGYVVLLSCHKEIRQLICDMVPLEERLTIVPNVEDKEWYRMRYKERGNTDEFIKVQMDNWEKWLNEEDNKLPNENWVVLRPHENLYDSLMGLLTVSFPKSIKYGNMLLYRDILNHTYEKDGIVWYYPPT